jgi:hypothetical protein
MAIWDKANVKTNIIPLFQRGKGKLTIAEKEDLKDYRGRVMATFKNVKVEAEEFGIGLPLLNTLLALAADNGVSCEVVGVKTAAGEYDGAYKFMVHSYLGLDFEYITTGKERKAAITLEASLDPVVVDAIITDAASNTYETLTGVSIAEYDDTLLRAPMFAGLYYQYTGGSSTLMFAKDELQEYKMSVKTAGEKTSYDRTVIRALEIALEFTVRKANKTDFQTLNALGKYPSISLVLLNTADTVERHTFAEKLLSMSRETVIGDDDRTMKIKLGGEVHLANVSYATTGGDMIYTYGL